MTRKAEEDPIVRRRSGWRWAGWSLAGLVLLAPLAAMQVTDEVDWSASDFLVMGALLGAVGLGFEFLARRSGDPYYRLGAAFALLVAFLTVWANLAVGMVGDEGDPYNLWFAAVLALALAGAILARFEPGGMAKAMLAAALAQAAAGAFGLPLDPRGGAYSIAFALPWLLAAACFRASAARRESCRQIARSD